jgi:phasin family protein
MKALFSVKDIKEFTDIANTAAQPAADKVSAYAQPVYAIATETGSEIAKIVEKHLADGNQQLHSAIDAMAKTAPAGSEGMVAIVKQAAAAASSAFDQVNRAARQAVDMTEANIASVTKTAAPATSKARRAA